MKALGTGWRRGVRWRDIEVVREPSGKPTLRLEGRRAKLPTSRREEYFALDHAQRQFGVRAGYFRELGLATTDTLCSAQTHIDARSARAAAPSYG